MSPHLPFFLCSVQSRVHQDIAAAAVATQGVEQTASYALVSDKRMSQLQLWLKKRHPDMHNRDVPKHLEWYLGLSVEEHDHLRSF